MGVFFEVSEGRFGMVEGRANGVEGLRIEGDMEVNAAFGGAGGHVLEIGEVFVAGQWLGI